MRIAYKNLTLDVFYVEGTFASELEFLNEIVRVNGGSLSDYSCIDVDNLQIKLYRENGTVKVKYITEYELLLEKLSDVETIRVGFNEDNEKAINFNQNDLNTRFIRVHINEEYSLDDVTIIKAIFIKPDKTYSYIDVDKPINSKDIIVPIPSSVLGVKGIVEFNLALYGENKKLTTGKMRINVRKTLGETEILSSNEWIGLDQTLARLEAWNEEFENKSGQLETIYMEELDGKINFTVDNTSNIEIPQVDEKLNLVNQKYNEIITEMPKINEHLDTNKNEIINNKKEIDSKYREEEFFNSKYEVYLRKISNLSPTTTNIIIDNNTDNRSKDFPCIELLTNGDLITIYRDGNDHASYDGVLKLSRSTDGGNNWSEPIIILSKTNADYRDPNILQSSNGTLILNYVERIENDEKTHRVRMARSIDNGNSWYDLGYMPMGEAKTYSSRGSLTQLPNGKILCPIYVKNGNSGAYLISSDDDGQTWNFYSWITKDNIIETSVCYHSARNEILAVIRGNELFSDVYNLKQRLYTTVSRDNGLTWERLHLLPLYGHCPIAQVYNNEYIISIRNTDFDLQSKYTADIFLCDGKTIKNMPYNVTGAEHTHDLGYIDFRIKNNNIYTVWYSYTKKIVFSVIPTSYLNSSDTFYKSYHTNTQKVTTELTSEIFTTGKCLYTAVGSITTDTVTINLPTKPSSVYYANLNFENMNKVMISEVVSYDKSSGNLTFGIRRVDGSNISNSEKTLYYFVVHN